MTPEPLQPDQCPLLKKYPDQLGPVLAEFNRAAETARKLAGGFPGSLEQEDVQDALARLADARKSLTTPRFKVGFLGRFQAGKSTALNNLLGQEISGVGVGGACTSIVTRLIVGRPGEPQKLTLKYFTVDGYLARRNTLCEWARLKNPVGQPDTQLLEKLRDHNPAASPNSSQRPVRDKDIPYLRAFIESNLNPAWGRLLRSEPYEETAPFNARTTILTHPAASAEEKDRIPPSKHLLVAESAVVFQTDQVDPELELVDCPGLASGRSVDDLLTREYIYELHGALMFLNADGPDSAEANEILAELKQRFSNNLRSRVWIVVNKMDGPERHAKVGGGERGQTVFDLIVGMSKKTGVPLSQVCLGCNGIFELASQSPSGVAARQDTLNLIKLTKPGDEDMVRRQLAPTPDLERAFDEMLKDGGVSLLRRLIKEKIGPSVAQELLGQAKRDSQDAADKLEFALRTAEQPVTEQELANALAWENALYLLLSELSGARPGGRGPLFARLEQLGREAHETLAKKFHEGAPNEVLDVMSAPELLQRFPIDANRMQREVNKEFDRVAHTAYADLTKRMDERQLPAVTLPDGREVMAVWTEVRSRDQQDGAWRDEVRPRLHDPTFLERLADRGLEQTFNPTKYKQLLLDKLRMSAHQITMGVRGPLRKRLNGVRREISRKLGPAAQGKPVTEERRDGAAR